MGTLDKIQNTGKSIYGFHAKVQSVAWKIMLAVGIIGILLGIIFYFFVNDVVGYFTLLISGLIIFSAFATRRKHKVSKWMAGKGEKPFGMIDITKIGKK